MISRTVHFVHRWKFYREKCPSFTFFSSPLFFFPPSPLLALVFFPTLSSSLSSLFSLYIHNFTLKPDCRLSAKILWLFDVSPTILPWEWQLFFVVIQGQDSRESRKDIYKYIRSEPTTIASPIRNSRLFSHPSRSSTSTTSVLTCPRFIDN